MDRIENECLIKQQLQDWKKLHSAQDNIKKDIERLYGQMKDFSIVLYGRTMTGKSTLMEILTHGNGASIGHGAQRTTRDVRSYYWKGLKITDVPGIGSFDGRDDDAVAFEAAKSADLVLFLITDDAPQAEEAKHLADLRQLGKPVLGIVNVKLAINASQRALSMRKLKQRLADTARLDEICQQFKDYGKTFGQDWEDIPFVYAHLKAAFLGLPEQGNELELFTASGFSAVENYILSKVRKDGCFLRAKTFTDSVAVPMQKIAVRLYQHGAENLAVSELYRSKCMKLLSWKKAFRKTTRNEIKRFIDSLRNELSNEAYSFSENHYEAPNAGEEWQEVLKSLKLGNRCELLLQGLADECEKKRKELSDELVQEMKYTFHNEFGNDISMEDITDTQSFMQTIGALGVGFFLGGPVGVLFSIISTFFFDSKAEKIRRAKKKLYDALEDSNGQLLQQMNKTLTDIANKKIFKEGVNNLAHSLTKMERIAITLADGQNRLAERILDRFSRISLDLVQDACGYVNRDRFVDAVGVLRVPGEKCCIICDKGIGSVEDISALLGESIDIIPSCKIDDTISWLEQLINQKVEPETYKRDKNTAHDVCAVKLPFSQLNEDGRRLVILWQQAVRLPIMNSIRS